MTKKMISLLLIVLGACLLLTNGCTNHDHEKILTVYSGKGLKKSMEELRVAFNKKHNIILNIIYGGSFTLLKTIQETGKGDVFIPGSSTVLQTATDLVDNHQHVVLHVPTICVHKKNPKKIQSLNDLANPGIRLTTGNENMCAIGKVADKIIAKSELKKKIMENIVIKSATVNELINLVINRETDAAIIWKDMLQWPEAKDLTGVEIPSDINEIMKIQVAVLKTSQDKKNAQLFADFVASEGKTVFIKNGFDQL